LDLLSGPNKPSQESLEKALELVQKALSIDDSFSPAHGLLSVIYSQKREYDKAIAEGERAVTLSPNGWIAHEAYAHSLFIAGRFKEAIPMFQKGIRLNPIGSSGAFTNLGVSYAMTGRFKEAVSAWKQAILRSPDNIFPHLSLASAYIAMGREKEARAEAAEVLRISPRFTLDNYAKGLSFIKDQSMIEKHIGNLRKAGLN
jgi:tetratricopeptide (TPR) repeat protein